jgi:membrane protease YdiL (CAAX protease family)
MAKVSKPITPASRIEALKEKIKKQSKKSKAWKALFIGLFGVALAAWVALVLYGAQFAVAFIFVKLLSAEQLANNVVNSIYQVIVYALALLVIIGLPWKILKRKTTRDELGLRGMPTWTDLLLAPIGFVVTIILSMALTAIMMAILPGVDWAQAQNVGYNKNMLYHAKDFLLAFTCLVVLAPVCEEIIFRGWLYGKLRFRMSAVPAILITSLLFGIVHGQWNVGVTVFAMSIGMCVMRELTGTIWGGILLHMIKNGLAFYFLFVA